MKYIKIETCGGCPYRKDSAISFASFCKKMNNKDIHRYETPFPEWCPLSGDIE